MLYYGLILGAIFYILHFRVGYLFRSKRCWVILGVSGFIALGGPMALAIMTGLGHPAPNTYVANGVFPYAILFNDFAQWTSPELHIFGTDSGILITMGLPFVQILYYGAGCAIASHLHEWRWFLLRLSALHVASAFLAFVIPMPQ